MSTPAPSHSSGTETLTRLVATAGDAPTADIRPRAGQPLPAVPGYRVVRWLGGGGMGDVYEVVDEKHGVPFALKIVRADRASTAFAVRFRQEVRAMLTLDHPHVARIFAHGEVDGRPYFTMRFVRGGTLADRLAELRADPRAAVRLLLKVIDAVDYLHRQGRVHRDLKPSNVLVDDAGEPYLSDFGLVKDLGESTGPDDLVPVSPVAAGSTHPTDETQTAGADAAHRHQTRTGAKVGTYAYMSPEAARGDVRHVGPASDVWALGVILYELLTGRRPDRDAAIPPPGVDPELDRIVGKCLSPEPGLRYPSAALLAADLRGWMNPAPAPAPGRRRRWPVFALLLALLFVGGGITLAVLRKGKDPEPTPREMTLDAWRAWARKELQAGRPVRLVAEDGTPAPGARFAAGAGPAKWETDSDGAWVVHTPKAALIEFLDDPGVDGFVLSGEFRGDVRARPVAGLYAASRAVPAAGGVDWHYQLEYRYQDNLLNIAPAVAPPAPPDPPKQLPPNVRVFKPVAKRLVGDPSGKREVRFHASPFDALGDNPEGGRSWEIGQDRPEPGGPWRKLAIRARGDAFTVRWDDEDEFPVPNLRPEQLTKLQNRGVLEWPDPPLRFTARGGLGVIVEGGSAAVRNLTVTPSP